MTRGHGSAAARKITRAGLAILALTWAASGVTSQRAWSAPPADPPTSRGPATVPTTRLLAIGSFTAKGTPDAWKPLLPAEVRETVRLYLGGKIDQWFVKQDQSGVVFLMNLTDPQEAQALLARLPFGQAGLMQFQIIPLGPISPLGLLLSDSAR
jgi:hypothetical protein